MIVYYVRQWFPTLIGQGLARYSKKILRAILRKCFLGAFGTCCDELFMTGKKLVRKMQTTISSSIKTQMKVLSIK
jgi:hypothetical protein